MGEHIETYLNKLKTKALINGATDATIIDAIFCNIRVNLPAVRFKLNAYPSYLIF